MVDLKPNELYTELEKKLRESGDIKPPDRGSGDTEKTGESEERGQTGTDAEDAASPRGTSGANAPAFGSARTPALVTLVGYLGEDDDRGGTTWRSLYLDWAMSRCLLIDEAGIIRWEQIKDDDADWDVRDVLWVKADAPVVVASGPESVEVQFLTGEFTRAGDFDVGTGGGTTAGATGVFCEARSVGCCGKTRRRTVTDTT
jgi:hypothetical protein